ncbi:unnamed protein product [Discosporangium mesarthrocarpum]
MTSPPMIPEIDIRPLLTEESSLEDRVVVGGRICTALSSVGLFFATGHGITKMRREKAFNDASEFFSLKLEDKDSIPARAGGFTRGYIGFGGESGSHRLECKEAFSYGYPWPEGKPPENSLQGANIWPGENLVCKGWRQGMLELFRLMVGVSEAISKGVSVGLGLGEARLPELCREGETISLMRLFHYFPYDNEDWGGADNNDEAGSDLGATAASAPAAHACQGGGADAEAPLKPLKQEKISSSPHTDWGYLTCILQDGTGGLQYMHGGIERWLDVPCVEGALVVNCGDYLSLLSGGRLRSPVHQVVTKGVERTSFVFFYYPSFNTTLLAPGHGKGKKGDDTVAALADLPNGAQGGVEGHTPWVKQNNCNSAGDSGHSYNTLLDLQDTVDLSKTSFGEYLNLKWGGVFRR